MVVPTTLIALDLKVVGRDVIAPGHSVMVFVAVGTLKTPPKAGKGKPTGDEIEELGMVDGQMKVGAAILEGMEGIVTVAPTADEPAMLEAPVTPPTIEVTMLEMPVAPPAIDVGYGSA